MYLPDNGIFNLYFVGSENQKHYQSLVSIQSLVNIIKFCLFIKTVLQSKQPEESWTWGFHHCILLPQKTNSYLLLSSGIILPDSLPVGASRRDNFCDHTSINNLQDICENIEHSQQNNITKISENLNNFNVTAFVLHISCNLHLYSAKTLWKLHR